MVTTEVFEKLKSLQVILGRKYELEAQIDEAPKQLVSQDELLAKLKKEFIEKSRERESVKDSVLSIKAELETAVRTREEGEKNMDSITTHREYEALDKQISEASLKETELRKELQKAEKELAALDDTIRSTEAMIASQESDLNTSKESLNNQINTYKAELDELKKREDEITPGLDQEILFKFQRIIQRNSEGIVAVKNGVCTGCHMILPAQYANEVHVGERILFCPYCSRILFYEQSDADTQETFFNDSGSLADLDDDFSEDDEEYDEDEGEFVEGEESVDEESSADEEELEGDSEE